MMCTIPPMRRRGKIRRSLMIVEELPVKFSKNLDLSYENSIQSPVSNTKPSIESKRSSKLY
eukprot:scaffold159315_cov82-Cyclotella_meneghiniana.AAC.2